MLENLSSRLSRILKTMRGQARLTEENTRTMLREVRLALLDADVALPVVRELIARIKAILRRTQSPHGAAVREEITNGPLRLCPSSRKAWVGEHELQFSDTEFRLLLTLMKNPGTVMTHEHLLRSVWGADAIGEVQYLRVAFARIRKKLEDAGLEGGVISAYFGVGYVLRDLDADPLPNN